MSRRSPLPGADELFRSTGPVRQGTPPEPAPARPAAPPDDSVHPPAPEARATSSARDVDALEELDALEQASRSVRPTSRRRARPVADRQPSGRERHDEKITVYISADELLDLEHARLALRGDHGLAVDRGRLVREALAVVLADFESKGETSILVRRLRGR